MSKTKYPCVYRNDATGRYYYNIELGIDKITGKRIQKKSSKSTAGKPFHTAKEAYDEVIKYKNDYRTIKQYNNYNMKYDSFMNEIFLPSYKGRVENSTWLSRQPCFKLLIERFGKKKMRDITANDCEQFRIYLLNNSKYSQSYASLIYGTFRKTLDHAVRLQYLESNISKRTEAISKGKTSVAYWTKEEFEKVLSTFTTQTLYEHMKFIMIWLYFMTGIRVSEGLALKWNDIDWNNNKLRVHGTLEFKNNRAYFVKPYTKTTSSRRIISLDINTMLLLKLWKEHQEQHFQPEFIISYSTVPLRRTNINRIINKHADIAKVHRIETKGLRHSHVSYLINEHNIDILVISRRLGHSSPDTTLKYYAHLWSRNDEKVADIIAKDIKINLEPTSKIDFRGNQFLKPR